MNYVQIFGIVFLSPGYLMLLVLLPIIVYYYKKKQKIIYNPLIFEGISKIYKPSFLKTNFGVIIISMIYLIMVLILANPNLTQQNQKVSKKGIDIGILLDVSYSMNASDFQPSRIQAAKKVLTGFIDGLTTDRAGLVVFAGKPFTSCPLTFDYEILKEVTNNITVNTINQNYSSMQGTAIGDGILAGINLFKDSKDREKVLILLTDGTANVGVHPTLASQLAKEKGIKIFTIGIGSKQGGYIELPGPFGRTLRQAVEGVDDKALSEIANISNGQYFKAEDKKALDSIFKQISKLEKKDIQIDKNTQFYPYYQIFVNVLVFLILIYVFYLANNDYL